jgi:hypothetical protein
MSKLLALLLLASTVGCSSLARGGAAGAARSGDDEVEEEDAVPVAVAEAAPPPGQTEVAWEDNGVPIRRLKGPGRPHEMKVPESNVQKKATTVTK